ncbi:hypothetical protein HanHA300_Chr09g0312491 [Helianthus annuus]|nr:hypothetical protein HanHA300_Chr09g0312491 [Helianthus annuus]
MPICFYQKKTFTNTQYMNHGTENYSQRDKHDNKTYRQRPGDTSTVQKNRTKSHDPR